MTKQQLQTKLDQMTARVARLEEFVEKIAAGDMPDAVNRRANARFILKVKSAAALRGGKDDE